MADTFPHRIRQAVADPGSIINRNINPDDSRSRESVTDWTARAVLQVVSEHVPTSAPPKTVVRIQSPLAVALLIAFNSLATLVGGLWIGSVWL